MRKSLFLVLAIVSVLFALRAVGRKSAPNPPVGPSVSADRVPANAEDELPTPIGRALATAPDSDRTPDSGTRTEELEPLSGLVRDAEGRAIVGALVTWTPTHEKSLEKKHARDLDREWIRARTRATHTGPAGAFAFEELPEALPEQIVLWVSHLEHAPTFALVAPSADGWGGPHRIGLERRSPTNVRVVLAQEPAPGSRVEHTLGFSAPELSEEARIANRFFLREETVGADATAAFATLEGSNAFQARRGELRSSLWAGMPETQLELELRGTFTLSGRVLVTGPAASFDGLRYNVGYYTAPDLSDFEWAAGAHRVNDADGRFGPHTWARPDHEMLFVSLRGGDLVPLAKKISMPETGAGAYVEFQTRPGHKLEAEVFNRDGSALSGASLEAFWLDILSDGYVRHGAEITDDRGRAVFRGLPEGRILLSASHETYQTSEVEDERTVLPRTDEKPVRIVLDAVAGPITVRGVFEGEPVPAYRLIATSTDRSYYRAFQVEDDDGEFLIEDAPGHTIFVLAYAESLAQSESVAIAPNERVEPVIVEFAAPRPLVGRVVDAVTGEPVPTAFVRHMISASFATKFIGARGAEVPVEPDGSFVLEGGGSTGGLLIGAAAYESLYFQTRKDDTAVIDMGDIPLAPMSTILVLLIGDESIDYTAYRAWNDNYAEGGIVTFESGGLCEVQTNPSLYELCVQGPDGTVFREHGKLVPGEEYFVAFDLTTGTDLFATLAEPLPKDVEGFIIEVYSTEEGRSRSRTAPWDSESRGFLLSKVPPGAALVEVLDPERKVVARHPFRVADAELQRIRLKLQEGTHLIRLVNGTGAPFASQSVKVFLGDGSGWRMNVNSDRDGIIEFGPLDDDVEEIILSTMPSREFCALGIVVDLPPAGEVAEITLESAGRCHLRVTEQGVPRRSIKVNFVHRNDPDHIFFYYSDTAGKISGPELRAGDTFLASIWSPGCWRTEHPIPAGKSHLSSPLEIEIFSLGRVDCSARDAEGRPLAGARFELRHEKLGDSVSTWLADERVTSSSSTLTTDASGELTLEGLPSGKYRWICRIPEGDALRGTLALPPAGSASLEARAPVR